MPAAVSSLRASSLFTAMWSMWLRWCSRAAIHSHYWHCCCGCFLPVVHQRLRHNFNGIVCISLFFAMNFAFVGRWLKLGCVFCRLMMYLHSCFHYCIFYCTKIRHISTTNQLHTEQEHKEVCRVGGCMYSTCIVACACSDSDRHKCFHTCLHVLTLPSPGLLTLW